VIEKKLHDGFYNTHQYTSWLYIERIEGGYRHFHSNLDNVCVKHTVMGAWERLYQPIVPEDAVTCPDENEHQWSLRYMGKFYGARIVNLSEALNMIKKSSEYHISG